jgi:hypothetical protein
MATGLIDIMKRAALDANESNKPADLRFGKVVSTSPLKVEITNQFVLPASILIVPEHLTDHEVEVTVTSDYGWKTENTNCYTNHKHDITVNKQKLKIHGALKVGDKVAVMRKQGGQFYYILDRLPKDE